MTAMARKSEADEIRRLFMSVRVTPSTFRILWLILVLIRLWCILFLSATTRLYWFVSHPYMTYYAALLDPLAGSRFKVTGSIFGVLGAIHVLKLLGVFYYSLCMGRLVLDTAQAAQQLQRKSGAVASEAHRMPRRRRRAAWWWCWPQKIATPKCLNRCVSCLFGRRGLFGVESDFFHARFLTQELLEYVSQTVQVYRSSVLIAKAWINHLYVSIMVINCWSTPVLQTALRHHPATERLVCLSIDLVLDMTTSTLIPLMIFLPYYRKFDLATYNFDLPDLYSDVWFANMVMENQQIFATSVLDFIFIFIPHLSIYSCLNNISLVIKPSRKRAGRRAAIHNTDEETLAAVAAVSMYSARDESSEMLQKVLQASPDQQPALNNKLGHAPMMIAHVGFFVWGGVILTLHLMAAHRSTSLDVPACKQPMRPWFATKYACSVLDFNCYRNGSTGVSEEALSFLHEPSLVALVFSHCPALTVPTNIRKFHNLLGVDIYNSTLVEWGREAAITGDVHPALVYIIFVRVNMTRLPDGVLDGLPSAMSDFEISVTNLTALPSDLHKRWHSMSIFYVEHTLISEFPSTLTSLQVDDLSLIGNSIRRLPEFPFDRPNFISLALTSNPLESLPESMGNTQNLGFLAVGDTLLLDFPSWITSVQKSAEQIFAYKTPFCLAKSQDEILTHYGPNAVLTCVDTDEREGGKYPLAIMAPSRQL